MSLIDDVSTIDSWFQSKCDGLWEHKAGVTIETTDNPGWWITIDNYSIDHRILPRITDDVLQKYGATVDSHSEPLRVFARSLRSCLQAVAAIMTSGEETDYKIPVKRRGKPRR